MDLVSLNKKLNRTIVQGIYGLPGAGKTSIGIIAKIIGKFFGKNIHTISLDDFYLSYAERKKIRKKIPALKFRGPPGTHQLGKAIEILQTLKTIPHVSVDIPKFDKSLYNGDGDISGSERISNIDILLFEG
jgi:D-glycerate 3-kinase